jgi:predicted RNase H-like HicB family nuclease
LGALVGCAYHRCWSEEWTCNSQPYFGKFLRGYVGFVEELPGANTQGATLDETRSNLQEAVTLVLEANRTLAEEHASGSDVIREPLKVRA